MPTRMLLAVLATTALAAPAAAKEKFAMAVYHFNLQYTAGGVQGFPTGDSSDPAFDLTEQETEDAIIVESFEPLLDIYLRHPTWAADFEMQGLMIDVIKARHPAVLAKLKTLVERGQAAIPAFHWSDQLWVAYPRRDEEVSWELTRQSFEQAGLPQAKAVWTQEGQWGPGLARFLKERGLEVAILPRNLFKYMHPGAAIAPLYQLGDVHCVVTNGTSDDRVETAWTFVDDGELAVTGRRNPYFGKLFKYDAEAAAKFEQGLVDTEASGFQLVTVEAYVRQALALGVVAPPLPEMVDGVWQPDDTQNVARWMGGAGILVALGSEEDNTVLTGNARIGRKIRTAEKIVAGLEAGATDDDDVPFTTHLDTAWRNLLLAEVSDATGWNPFIGERRYAMAHQATAEAAVDRILKDDDVADRLVYVHEEEAWGPTYLPGVAVRDSADQRTRTWSFGAEAGSPALFPLEISGDPARTPSVAWRRNTATAMNELTIAMPAAKASTVIDLSLPRTSETLVFSDALEETTTRTLDVSTMGPELLGLALPNGLISLGTSRFLIKDLATVHIAALVPKAEKVIRFEDATTPAAAFSWRFVVVEGTKEQALLEANALNVDPVLALGPESCGCASPLAAWPTMIALLGLLLRRRRAGNRLAS